jgi:hypothetical protein
VEAVARTSQLILLMIQWPAVTIPASTTLNRGTVTLGVAVDVCMRTRARCICSAARRRQVSPPHLAVRRHVVGIEPEQ